HFDYSVDAQIHVKFVIGVKHFHFGVKYKFRNWGAVSDVMVQKRKVLHNISRETPKRDVNLTNQSISPVGLDWKFIPALKGCKAIIERREKNQSSRIFY
ncbi:hypothetical protein AVEN_174570-1, partial [Araneus ventricosus]